MYKWVQEPGVVARFMAGRGKTHFSPFSLGEEHRLLGVGACIWETIVSLLTEAFCFEKELVESFPTFRSSD